MPNAFVVIISQAALQGFSHPGLDLQTGEIIELEAEPAPVQLELFGADGGIRGDHNAKVAHCRNYLT